MAGAGLLADPVAAGCGADEAGERRDEGVALYALANLLGKTGKFDEAIVAGKDAVAIFRVQIPDRLQFPIEALQVSVRAEPQPHRRSPIC